MESNKEKWHSQLSIWVIGILFFELISGLVIYLVSFSLTTQALVVIHTAVGLVVVIPYIIYQIRHWFSARNKKLTQYKLTGYLSMVTAVGAIISGLLLCYEAIFLTRINNIWDKIHIASTFAFMLSVVPHIGLIIIRDFKAIKEKNENLLIKAEKTFGTRILFICGSLIAITALFIYTYSPIHYHNKFPADYQFIYGKNKPFQPSLATTINGEAIDARLLGNSKSCMSSGCHTNIGIEWESDAHRYAAMDPAFRVVQHAMAVEKGPASTRYCGGCHDPISLLSGSKNLDDKKLTNPIGLDEGISCVSCHSITKVDVRGNAQYQITKPVPYMFEMEKGKAAKFLSDFLIRSYPSYHISTFNRTLLRTPEFCGSCHKQFIDKQVNGVGWVQLQNQYDNWRTSHWNHPGQPLKTIECRECHMPLVSTFDPANGDLLDYNRTPNDHKHRSHRFLGGNQFMPTLLKLPGGKKQVQLVIKWLKGDIQIPEIKNKWHNGPAIPIQLETPKHINAGQGVGIGVTVTNNKPGHNFPTGPLDLIEAWIRLTVKDKHGHLVFSSGVLDKHHFIPPGSYIYRVEPVDQYGSIIDRHNLWELVGVKFSRALYPGFSDLVKYNFIYKPWLQGHPHTKDTLFVNAELCYRKFNQFVFNRFFNQGKTDNTAPVTVLSSDDKIIIVKRSYSNHL
ncbi:MAG TPA: cytochrome b/b6 domain-containing protein [Chitinophagaceae bacterium]|nr:cytochrome b/b6 domain-containing protein [Chitinophagaceae bacterium]